DQTMALQPHSSGVKIQDLILDHQDKYMMKAQVHVSKSSAISDEQALPQRKHHCFIIMCVEGEIVGKAFKISSMRVSTQGLQGGIKDNDLKIKIQAHMRANDESKKFPRTQGSKFKEVFI
nr:hypothetical protein [Tanacetum cinerariifolium]